MPNRIIREAILSSEKMALLDWAEEVFYRRLLSIVDDHGRYEANPKLLRAKCYPLQVDSVKTTDVGRWLTACQNKGLIHCYAVADKPYLEVLNFGQQLRSPSKFPPPAASDGACNHLIAGAGTCAETIGNAHLGVSVSEVVGVSEVVAVADTKTPARKRAAPAELVCVEKLMRYGVQEQHAKDWLEVRRKKEAPLTPTAWKAVQAQAELAGLTLDQAVEMAAVNNWAGFKADWVARAMTVGANGNGHNKQTALEGRVVAAAQEWLDKTEGVTVDEQR